MVHYQPRAQVPARRGGRSRADPGRRCRLLRRAGEGPGPPRRLCGAASRERRRGGRALPRLIYGPHVVEGEGVGSPLPALLPPHPPSQSPLRESRPGPGHLPPGMLGLHGPGVLWGGGAPQTSSRRRLCKVVSGLQYLGAQTCLVSGVRDSSLRLQTKEVV